MGLILNSMIDLFINYSMHVSRSSTDLIAERRMVTLRLKYLESIEIIYNIVLFNNIQQTYNSTVFTIELTILRQTSWFHVLKCDGMMCPSNEDKLQQ